MRTTKTRRHLAIRGDILSLGAATAIVAGLGACSTNPGPYQSGLSAYNAGDYTTAIQNFREAAPENPAAEHALGYMYEAGVGVDRDLSKAAAYYERSAAAGSAVAQLNLALMYDDGRGVPQDHAKAAQLYRRAAEQGLAEAQNNLGRMLREGEGVPKDPAQAFIWMQKAAVQGYPAAQNSLGLMYFTGQGVTPDPEQAYIWFALAVQNGQPGAEINRDFAASFLRSDRLIAADQRVASWSPVN